MKKNRKTVLSVMLAICLIASALPFIVPVSAAGIPTATASYGKPLAIDGKYDDGWEDAEIFATSIGKVTGISGTWSAMYDETHLYLLIEVLDKTVGTVEQEFSEPGGIYYWMRNTVQVFFDWGNDRTPGIYDSTDWGANLNCREFIYYHQAPNADFKSVGAVDAFKTDVTDDGYSIEISVDYKKAYPEATFNPKKDEAIGFGIVICDADAVDWGRKDYGFWGNGLDMHADPINMGRLDFVPAGDVPPAGDTEGSADVPTEPIVTEPVVSETQESESAVVTEPVTSEAQESESAAATEPQGSEKPGTKEPDATKAPETDKPQEPAGSGAKTGLIIGAIALAAVVIAVVLVLVLKKKKA
ncbi:MAG: hypothetical protein J6Z80_02925 [Clostridia bacterium]|nr:hypothetical protein [Clostridia bacterium]